MIAKVVIPLPPDRINLIPVSKLYDAYRKRPEPEPKHIRDEA